MADDRPAWARRMYNERQARGWSQADAIRAMRAHSAKELPGTSSLLRQYKRWEAGEVTPREFYQPVIAETFGTVTHASSSAIHPAWTRISRCWLRVSRWPRKDTTRRSQARPSVTS